MTAADALVCLVTTPPDQADTIATALVTEQLAACVNIVPQVRSFYRWEGEVQRDDEALLVVKTTRAAVPALEDQLRRIHPYDNFELITLDVTGGAAPYLAWLAESVRTS